MALTETQRAYYRTRLGTGFDEADLEARLARLGSDPKVAREVLEERLATAIAGPLKFSVAGEYSEDRAGNVSELRAAIAQTAGDELGAGGAHSRVRIVKPAEPIGR